MMLLAMCRNYPIARLALPAVAIFVLILPLELLAQEDSNPKYDIFLGYQWLHPGGNVGSPQGTPANPMTSKIPDMSKGGAATFTFNFTPHWGLSADFGQSAGKDNYETTVSAGPRFIWRAEDTAFFAHAMLGWNRLNIDRLGVSNRVGGLIGGGMDLRFTHLISWRVFEVNFAPVQHHYSQFSPSDAAKPALLGTMLRTGLVFSFDYPQTSVVGASVSVQPAQVLVGEPLTATATPENFNPKHELQYDWTTSCGKISGNGPTASIDSNGAAEGNCTASVRITDSKAKKNNQAAASASFTVKQPPKNPPIVSCSANPSSVQAGASVSLSCTCNSPDNVPVSMGNYTATAGTISGSGNTATLNTAGSSPGTIAVSATCTDQRGLSTPATSEITIEAPPVNPEVQRLEQRLSLHSIYFPTAQPTPTNPSGGLVKSQQDTLVALATDFKKYLESKPDAHLILSGHTDPRGSVEYNQALSERRVYRTKGFLVSQGIAERSIETKALGEQDQLTADQVRESVEQASELTPGEKQRILRNMRTIILASNRRVDVTLSTTGQSSVRQFPFNAADSLTLIGGREKPAPKAPPKKRPIKKK